jgi:transposase-like protein
MAEKSKKLKSSKRKIISREPYKRRSEAEKQKIIYEVTKGLIGIRAACRKYGVNRNTLKNWMESICLPNLADTIADEPEPTMPASNSENPSNRQIKALINALAEAELKISGLQTMIEVAEEEFRIKIRKKRGTKQSKK